MIELNSSKSSITADTAFRKDIPCRGALLFPYTHDQHCWIKIESHDETVPRSTRKSRGGHPTKLPVTKLGHTPKRTQGCVGV